MDSSAHSAHQTDAEQDPFDSVLNLEAQYYTEGYNLGVVDGSQAGRIEGRVFGLEKGFEKFAEMGRLGGRAAVWSARLPSAEGERGMLVVSGLSGSEKLHKHVRRLRELADPGTLVVENSEDAVSDFDDRLKDARAKATLISRIVGEDEGATVSDAGSKASSSAMRLRTPAKSLRVKRQRGVKGSAEMEDFEGLPRSKNTLR